MLTFLDEAETHSHPDTITYSHPLTPVGPSFIKRIPFQRLVLWNMGNIFSQNSGTQGGYGCRLALVKLNLQHSSS